MTWIIAWGTLGWLAATLEACLDVRLRARCLVEITRLQRLKRERDCLAHWLKVNGWKVEFREDRVVITRTQTSGETVLAHDPEEAKLARLSRRKRRWE